MKIKRTILLFATALLAAVMLASCESTQSVALYKSGNTADDASYGPHYGMTPPSTQLQ